MPPSLPEGHPVAAQPLGSRAYAFVRHILTGGGGEDLGWGGIPDVWKSILPQIEAAAGAFVALGACARRGRPWCA